MPPRPETIDPEPTFLRSRVRGRLEALVLSRSVRVIVVMTAIVSGNDLRAQVRLSPTISAARQPEAVKTTQPRHPVAEAVTSLPTAPPTTISPSDQPPSRATVTWDQRGLAIEASNSSLNQILLQIATDTGTRLEGYVQDQRVFGSYGPGPASEVVLKLLDGSGYNVLMMGGRDGKAPLKIVLTARSTANAQSAANNQNRSNPQDDEAGEQPDPEPQTAASSDSPNPEAAQNPFSKGNGDLPHDPAEFMQGVLDRQHKIDQQQQDSQNNPQQ